MMRRKQIIFVIIMGWILSGTLPLGSNHIASAQQEELDTAYDYLVLATTKTSTMQEEIQAAAEQGYAFAGVMGGSTMFGGNEVVVLMQRSEDRLSTFDYQLLATSKTSTMQQEMQVAGDAGYVYKGQTVFESVFGGSEAVVILERNRDAPNPNLFEYRLLATKKTSTMQEELRDAGASGFVFVGVTVNETRFGGDEIVTILKRARGPLIVEEIQD